MTEERVSNHVEKTNQDFETLRIQFSQGLLSRAQYFQCLKDTILYYKEQLLGISEIRLNDDPLSLLEWALFRETDYENYIQQIKLPELFFELITVIPTPTERPGE